MILPELVGWEGPGDGDDDEESKIVEDDEGVGEFGGVAILIYPD